MSQAGFQEPGFQQGVSLAARSITLRLQRHAGRGPEGERWPSGAGEPLERQPRAPQLLPVAGRR